MKLLPKALLAKQDNRNKRIQKVLEYIQKERAATTGQLQEYLKLSPMTVFRYMNLLITQGKVRFEGKRRGRIYHAI